MKVLIVDDSHTMQEILKHQLGEITDFSAEIYVASSGEEAVEQYPIIAPDVMLLDYIMKGMNGIDVLKALGGEKKPLPVVMVTSFNEVETIVEATNAGAQNYVLKDRMSPQMLSFTITEAVKKYRIKRDSVRRGEELQRFSYTVAHDLTDQISSVHSVLDYIALEKDHLSDARSDMLDSAITVTHNMQKFVKDLLHYAKAGHKEEDFTSCDVSEVVQGAVDGLHTRIASSGAIISFDPIKGRKVYVAQSLFLQLMLNIIGNAMKYVDKGTVPRIEITAQDAGLFTHFSVADNGCGIADEYIDKVFLPFGHNAKSDVVKGTGIGLATCRRIVEDVHGGRIWVESTLGKGSTFHFTLPRDNG